MLRNQPRVMSNSGWRPRIRGRISLWSQKRLSPGLESEIDLSRKVS